MLQSLQSKWWPALVHILFPSLCKGCSRTLHQAGDLLCFECFQSLDLNLSENKSPEECCMRLAGRFPFESAYSCYSFTQFGLVQELIHQLKYKQETELGILLGKRLGELIRLSTTQPDYIIPIPLHPKKEKKRGYNQSYFIAEGIHRLTGIPLLLNVLQRIKNTESQTTKSRLERLENVGNAFAIQQKDLLQDKHILLVDDVLTTGATMEAAALALQRSSSCTTSIAVVALAAH